ncbi:hypothetical protein FYX12_18170 [Salmonella enterica subsp. enterica]|nr:hypothetical protein [Salmonella enterica]ECQ1602961.1 hypothetical protein [Salmonella enterica subsp. enterica serovar Thompson]EDH5671662.1 hypothetical protein [Salmonella enterica subsp. enterica serovar Stanley]EDL3490099.1 hypothetical protein [Salmonella enterica subsp. enterica serovar Newport]EDP8882501.1 hypothetical protein [Salmonella enterica subsp. enterica]EEA8744119.1 hypothetical protein [Salmonella enterica subsp. enterica serovar Bareilly]EEE9937321.1 hypothetical prote
MATRNLIITNDWTQITDSTKSEVVQFRGEIAICNSPDKPAPDAPALTFESQTLTITDGDIAWGRTLSPDNQIILVIW